MLNMSKKLDRIVGFGISMESQVLKDIDRIRGDTNRSLWLKRLAVRELESLKKEQHNKKLEGAEVPTTHSTSATTTSPLGEIVSNGK
jgi:hypothetical protein